LAFLGKAFIATEPGSPIGVKSGNPSSSPRDELDRELSGFSTVQDS
jgi:hypothetical protein